MTREAIRRAIVQAAASELSRGAALCADRAETLARRIAARVDDRLEALDAQAGAAGDPVPCPVCGQELRDAGR